MLNASSPVAVLDDQNSRGQLVADSVDRERKEKPASFAHLALDQIMPEWSSTRLRAMVSPSPVP